MCHKHSSDAVDLTLRNILQSVLPFGRKVFRFSGDFRQVLPVAPGGSRARTTYVCIRSSLLFPKLKTLHLTVNMRLAAMRQHNSSDVNRLLLPSFLLTFWEGIVQDTQDERIILPSGMDTTTSFFDLWYRVFDGQSQHYQDIDWLISRAVLSTKICPPGVKQ